MLRICRLLAADALQFVAHPVIHVKDEVGDRVGEAFHVTGGKFSGDVFHACERVDVGAFATEEFGEGLLGHLNPGQIINHKGHEGTRRETLTSATMAGLFSRASYRVVKYFSSKTTKDRKVHEGKPSRPPRWPDYFARTL